MQRLQEQRRAAAQAVTTTSKPDKAAIKEALKAGRQITGAQLVSRRSWRIH
jgi:hypothetical protein